MMVEDFSAASARDLKTVNAAVRGARILFLDLDDTLLTDDKTVTDENRAALADWLAAGNMVCITTGRSVHGGLMVAEPCHLTGEGCYLIAFQGNIAYDCASKRIIAEETMPTEDAIELLTAFQDAGIAAHTFGTDGLFSAGETEEFRKYNSICNEPYTVYHKPSELREKTLYKVIAIDYAHPERLHKFCEDFAPKERGRFSRFFSQPMYLEYCKAGVSKGTGLQMLAKTLDIPLADTVAIGDERNDSPMIEAAGFGVCMQNGHADVKKAADYVTERDNNHSGVAEVIAKLL